MSIKLYVKYYVNNSSLQFSFIFVYFRNFFLYFFDYSEKSLKYKLDTVSYQ